MLKIDLTQEKLDIQKNVVIEEYKQRYLNQPYADSWLHLRPMAYKKHPYQWPTIGKKIEHIEKASLEDVKAFYNNFYNPSNAILALSGDFEVDAILNDIQKWFGSIPNSTYEKPNIIEEPVQNKLNEKVIKGDFPANKIIRVWHMPSKTNKGYHAIDMVSDILSNGKSSRFNQKLVLEKQVFTQIEAYITGDIDPGLFVISGRLGDGVNIETAIEEIDKEILEILKGNFSEDELTKVKNKFKSSFEFYLQNGANKTLTLSYYELLGNANLLFGEVEKYASVTKDLIVDEAKKVFNISNESRLIYLND
jgi:predicted Zn-dependent peptidase